MIARSQLHRLKFKTAGKYPLLWSYLSCINHIETLVLGAQFYSTFLELEYCFVWCKLLENYTSAILGE